MDGKYELSFFLHVIDYETYMFRTSAMDYFPPHLISCHLNFALCAESVMCDCARKIYEYTELQIDSKSASEESQVCIAISGLYISLSGLS